MRPNKLFNPRNAFPAVCGHRGAPALAPENTIESFAAAREAGATWLEFDVRPTADKRLVVHHDPVTAEGLHLGSTNALDLPAYIPPLGEVVDQFGDLVLDIELKTDDTLLDAAAYTELAVTELTQLVGNQPAVSALVTSFDADVLALFAEHCPDIPTGFLYYVEDLDVAGAVDRANEHAIAHALDIGHVAVVPHHRLVTALLVEAAHDNDLLVATWTVNSLEDVGRCARAGVDVIIGDDPQMIVKGIT